MQTTDPFGPHGYIETEVNGVFIRLTKTVDGGYTRRVWQGTHRYDGLAAGHTDMVLAARECSAIRNRLLAGERAIDVEDDYIARQRAVLAATADVLNAAIEPPARPFVPTRTRVHTQPLTAAELDRIRAHNNGVVTLLPGQPWTLLRAIVRRGYGEPVYGTRRKLTAVRLNGRGLAVAEQMAVAA